MPKISIGPYDLRSSGHRLSIRATNFPDRILRTRRISSSTHMSRSLTPEPRTGRHTTPEIPPDPVMDLPYVNRMTMSSPRRSRTPTRRSRSVKKMTQLSTTLSETKPTPKGEPGLDLAPPPSRGRRSNTPKRSTSRGRKSKTGTPPFGFAKSDSPPTPGTRRSARQAEKKAAITPPTSMISNGAPAVFLTQTPVTTILDKKLETPKSTDNTNQTSSIQVPTVSRYTSAEQYIRHFRQAHPVANKILPFLMCILYVAVFAIVFHLISSRFGIYHKIPIWTSVVREKGYEYVARLRGLINGARK